MRISLQPHLVSSLIARKCCVVSPIDNCFFVKGSKICFGWAAGWVLSYSTLPCVDFDTGVPLFITQIFAGHSGNIGLDTEKVHSASTGFSSGA